jgi:hypothetical protein
MVYFRNKSSKGREYEIVRLDGGLIRIQLAFLAEI